MAEILASADLPAEVASRVDPALLAIMLAAANSRASRVAPCLTSTDPAPDNGLLEEARLVLIGAIGRWSQAGSGAFQQQTAGVFGVTIDTRQRSGYNLWPSEIVQLQDICKNGSEGKVFAVDTAPDCLTVHSLLCSLTFGATYCSCGADIAGDPLYELD